MSCCFEKARNREHGAGQAGLSRHVRAARARRLSGPFVTARSPFPLSPTGLR